VIIRLGSFSLVACHAVLPEVQCSAAQSSAMF
jgi:hypothetical protein